MNRFLLILGLGFLLTSCSKEEIHSYAYPCLDGECNTEFWIDPLVSPGVYQDENGYWHIEHHGYNYFTIKGRIDELHPGYVVNDVPVISTVFDSDYWVWIDGITFTVPLYSPLGYFTDGDFNNPIPIGNMTYTIEDMAQNHPPLNIVGYSYNPGSDVYDLGTYSRYNYTPQQQIFFDNQMVGDTAKVFIETSFTDDIIINKEFKIIFDEFD